MIIRIRDSDFSKNLETAKIAILHCLFRVDFGKNQKVKQQFRKQLS